MADLQDQNSLGGGETSSSIGLKTEDSTVPTTTSVEANRLSKPSDLFTSDTTVGDNMESRAETGDDAIEGEFDQGADVTRG